MVVAITIFLCRNKSTKIALSISAPKDTQSLLSLCVRSLDSAICSCSIEYTCSIGRVKRAADVDFDGLKARSDALLRQMMRWILAAMRFIDPVSVQHEATQSLTIARASDIPDALLQCAVDELETVASLYAHCVRAKESVPGHVRNLCILVVGVVSAELLLTPDIDIVLTDNSKVDEPLKLTPRGRVCKNQKKVPVDQQLRKKFMSVLKHLMVTAQPGQPELLTNCQGLFLKHSIPRGAEVCGLLKKILVSDADLRTLHTQVTHHSQAHQQHPPDDSSPRDVPTSSSALSKRPASTQNLDMISLVGESSVNPTATKKIRKERPIASESTPPVLTSAPSLSRHTDKKVKQEGIAQANSTPEGHVTYHAAQCTFNTSHSVASSASSASLNAPSSSVSRIRANNSFLSAIMEVPTASPVPPELLPQLSQSDAVLSPAATAPLQYNEQLEFTPASRKRNLAVSENKGGDSAGEVQVKSESASQSSKPVVVTHVSRKFGGGF